MRRATRGVLLIGMLVLGGLIGMNLPRTGPLERPLVVAQVGGAARDQAYAGLARQAEDAQRVLGVFATVARLVAPSVVHIEARKVAHQGSSQAGSAYDETGSGVLIRLRRFPGTYVLTNNHVVEGSDPARIKIHLNDGRQLRPIQSWTDPKADVAVLRIQANDVPVARLGDSARVIIGEWVLAIGSPFGLNQSVSHGIISAKSRRDLDLGQDAAVLNQDFLQTDAAINPGNSGGPLVNLRGEVIGVNTAIASSSGGSEGVGFSIPINLAQRVMAQLIATGRVRRAYLGVGLKPVDAPLAERIGLERPRGALIERIYAGTPAARAGLRVGDVVLEFDGVPIEDFKHLINLVTMAPLERAVGLKIWRQRRIATIAAHLGDLDQFEATQANTGRR